MSIDRSTQCNEAIRSDSLGSSAGEEGTDSAAPAPLVVVPPRPPRLRAPFLMSVGIADTYQTLIQRKAAAAAALANSRGIGGGKTSVSGPSPTSAGGEATAAAGAAAGISAILLPPPLESIHRRNSLSSAASSSVGGSSPPPHGIVTIGGSGGGGSNNNNKLLSQTPLLAARVQHPHHQARALTSPSTIVPRPGYPMDNEYAHLVVSVGMTFCNGRFEALYELGTGGFGQVLLCRDHHKVASSYNSNSNGSSSSASSSSLCAVKIMRSDTEEWAQLELDALQHLITVEEDPRSGALVRYYGNFLEYGHHCFVFEHMKMSLLQILESRQHRGLGFARIREVSKQLLTGLACLHDHKIIHADVKPENIMVSEIPASNHRWVCKLIDFGSCCSTEDQPYTYIQSRYYRAPEVIVGGLYDERIDSWAAGATIAEMFLGIPLFPGTSEFEQLHLIKERFAPEEQGTSGGVGGDVPRSILMDGCRTNLYYDTDTLELKSKQEFYAGEGVEEIPEQPRCYRYSEFSKIISHRACLVEDIQAALDDIRSGRAYGRAQTRSVLETGNVRSGFGGTVPSSYLSPSASVVDLRVAAVKQNVAATVAKDQTRQVIDLIEFQRWQLADFLQKLLAVDPEQRLTAKAALNHPFLGY